jgi:serine phosphatase RsbU (regulator of sigma subunit)
MAFLMHEAARAYLFNGFADKARPLGERALEMAEHLDIVEVQAEALATLGLLSDQPPEAALEMRKKAVELAEAAGLLSQAARAHVNLAAMHSTVVVDFRSALEHYRRAAELRRQRGDTAGELLSLGGATDLSLRLGDFECAEAEFRVMHRLLDELATPGPAAFVLRINRVMLLRYQGDLEEAVRLMRALQTEARQRDDLHNLIEIDSQLADMLLESRVLAGGTRVQGLAEHCSSETEAALLEALQICQRWGLSGIHPRCLLSEVRACQRQFKDAVHLLAEVRETASSRPIGWEEVWLVIAEARVSAAQDRWSESLLAFEAAAGICARLEMRWWWARMLQEWAEAHAARGESTDLERARALLREALTTFRQLGTPRYAALAEGKLQAMNAAIYAEMLAHHKVTQELAVASRIQESFLPPQPPHIPGWHLAVTLESARQTSGDFYDLISLPNRRWGIVIADVVDKGMGAALYMALSRTLIRTYASEYHASPGATFRVVNHRILTDAQVNMFVTAFYGVLDPFTNTLTYCNAGHNPPYLLRPRQAGTPNAVQLLHRTGMPLGILEGTTWEQNTVQFAPGDVLVLYTDGVTEAHNAQEELFGQERALKAAQANLERSAQDIMDALLAEVREFVGNAPQFDDITLMVVVRDPDS